MCGHPLCQDVGRLAVPTHRQPSAPDHRGVVPNVAKTFLKIFAVVLLVLCAADLRTAAGPSPVAGAGHRTGRRTGR